MKRAVCYARVSTKKQVDGYSISDQLADMRKYARKHSLEIIREFIEPGVTGETLNRPALNELREFVRSGQTDHIIFAEIDRISRDRVHQAVLINEIEEADTDWHSVRDGGKPTTPEAKMLFGMKGLFAEYERVKTLERTSRGRRARLASGKLIHGNASYLFGYDYKIKPNGGDGTRKINPERSRVVKQIFSWFNNECLPLDRIVYRLSDLGILSPTGKPIWPRASVYKLLTNSAYCGQDIGTPAIIDRETFETAQARLKRNKELAKRNVKRDYLLRGYVYCQHCGRHYQGTTKRDQIKEGIKEYQYYRCSNNFKINLRQCSNQSWKTEPLDDLVWQQVEAVLSDPKVVLVGLEVMESEAGQQSGLEQELAQVNNRLKEVDREQEELLQWALRGFPKEAVEKENNRLNQDRAYLKERKSELETRIKQAKGSQLKIDDIQKACQIVRDNLGRLTFDTKRLALEAFDIKVWLDNDNVVIEGNIPISLGALYPLRQDEVNTNDQTSFPFSLAVTAGSRQ